MRALVFGGTGMLGRSVTQLWRQRGATVLALDSARADITDRSSVDSWVAAFHPQVIINCAAFTRVDDCETDEEQATRVNGYAVENLVAAARERQAALVHISSDYVFGDVFGDAFGGAGGEARQPILEDATTGPRSAYGRGKLVGEEIALAYEHSLVVRASWLFGPGGPNFVATIRRLLLEGRTPLRVVNDQVGRPTYTPFVARALWDLLAQDARGVIHYGNREATSWHGFACEIARMVDPRAEVLAVPTSAFPRPAERPAYSVLDVSKFEAVTGRVVEPWLLGLVPYLEILGGH